VIRDAIFFTSKTAVVVLQCKRLNNNEQKKRTFYIVYYTTLSTSSVTDCCNTITSKSTQLYVRDTWLHYVQLLETGFHLHAQ